MLVPILLSNLLNSERYARKILPHLQSEYFQVQSERVIYEIIRDYINGYNNLPNLQTIRLELFNKTNLNEHIKKECQDLITEISKSVVDDNIDYLVNQTEKFCQDRSIELALYKSIDILQDKASKLDRGAIPKILQDALSVSFDPHIGHDYIEDAQKRYDSYNAVEDRIPFDIELLNKITNDGLPRKTLTILLAGVHIGKSLTMCHMAASNLKAGKNVLYISGELSEEMVGERIDANLLDIPIDQLRNIPHDIFMKKIERIKSLYSGRLKIKEYPTAAAGSDHFRYLLNELKLKSKFVPDIIYIDYLNICKSSRIKYTSNVNTYLYVMTIAQEIRGLAVEFNLPIVTATQLNRTGFTDSDPGMEHAAESFGTMGMADLVLVLTANEDLEQQNQISVKQEKNRLMNRSYYKRFLIGCDRSKMRLYDLENQQVNTPPTNKVVDVPVMDRALNKEKGKFADFS